MAPQPRPATIVQWLALLATRGVEVTFGPGPTPTQLRIDARRGDTAEHLNAMRSVPEEAWCQLLEGLGEAVLGHHPTADPPPQRRSPSAAYIPRRP